MKILSLIAATFMRSFSIYLPRVDHPTLFVQWSRNSYSALSSESETMRFHLISINDESCVPKQAANCALLLIRVMAVISS